jgi:hypothetical protein
MLYFYFILYYLYNVHLVHSFNHIHSVPEIPLYLLIASKLGGKINRGVLAEN